MKKNSKNERFGKRLTEEEKNRLITEAYRANKDVSSFVRDLVFGGDKTENFLLEIRRENYDLKKLLWGDFI